MTRSQNGREKKGLNARIARYTKLLNAGDYADIVAQFTRQQSLTQNEAKSLSSAVDDGAVADWAVALRKIRKRSEAAALALHDLFTAYAMMDRVDPTDLYGILTYIEQSQKAPPSMSTDHYAALGRGIADNLEFDVVCAHPSEKAPGTPAPILDALIDYVVGYVDTSFELEQFLYDYASNEAGLTPAHHTKIVDLIDKIMKDPDERDDVEASILELYGARAKGLSTEHHARILGVLIARHTDPKEHRKVVASYLKKTKLLPPVRVEIAQSITDTFRADICKMFGVQVFDADMIIV